MRWQKSTQDKHLPASAAMIALPLLECVLHISTPIVYQGIVCPLPQGLRKCGVWADATIQLSYALGI